MASAGERPTRGFLVSEYGILIHNALILDGTGRPAYRGSVAIAGERIAAVGDMHGRAGTVIDADGLAVCPGFVDTHSHADMSILRYPLAENLVIQGITTFLGGNCGGSPAPLKDPEAAQRALADMDIYAPITWGTFGEWLSAIREDREATASLVLGKRENPGALSVFLRHPAAMPATDCQALAAEPPPDASDVYFRMAFGLFPHYLRTFVHEQRTLSLEEAVHKASFVPAQQVLGLTDRAVIKPGAYADLGVC